MTVTALCYASFRHYDSSRPYVEDFSQAVYIQPGDAIPGGWQSGGVVNCSVGWSQG